jgi:hypothetical protein
MHAVGISFPDNREALLLSDVAVHHPRNGIHHGHTIAGQWAGISNATGPLPEQRGLTMVFNNRTGQPWSTVEAGNRLRHQYQLGDFNTLSTR